ncbi:hypothetical protein [Halobacterium litoreum]|uniref:DUF7978 domain-containing protein n=1 Tax=Halobacterium litoreum TaxID=2039234 RepID=A0ABD5NHF7_9EURY|nr:hypothetical protein [Halobacterium litoreum]UHH12363.1 hypothetical protein LT972_09355 [Halobacterium litoreum]
MAQRTRTSSSLDTDHAIAASKYAVGAYVAGLAVTVVVLAIFVDGFDFDVFGIGATFYGAHNVDIGTSMLSLNFLQAATSQESALEILWAVPPIVLAFAGYTFANTRAGQSVGSEPMDGAKAGALVAVGYLVLAVVGTFVFTEGNASPKLGDSVIFMGVLYPVVFGGIGGYLSR